MKSLDAPGRSSIACRIAFWAGCWWHQGLVCLLLPSNSQKPMGDGKGAKLFPSTPSTDGPCSIWEVDVAQLDHIRSPYLSYQKRFIFHIIYDYIYIYCSTIMYYIYHDYIYIFTIFLQLSLYERLWKHKLVTSTSARAAAVAAALGVACLGPGRRRTTLLRAEWRLRPLINLW